MPGLLIEYLITGSLALYALWFGSHIALFEIPMFIQPEKLTAGVLGALIPGIYVSGMLIDFISKLITGLLATALDKQWHPMVADKLRARFPGKFKWLLPKRKVYDHPLSTAHLFEKSEVLSSQFEMRSSRDRIARGTFVIVGSFTTVLLWNFISGDKVALPELLIGTALTVVSFFMWRRFKRLSSRWKSEAGIAIIEK